MYRKNVAGQYLYFVLVDAATGAAVTGATPTGKRSIDGAAQASVTGTITEDALGQYHLALSQADTNGNDIGFIFTNVGSVPVGISVVTTAADPTDSVRFGLTALPNAAANAANGLPTAGSGTNQITLSGGKVALTATQAFDLTGNITGNLSGSVGSVTGNVGGNLVGTLSSTERDAIGVAALKYDWTSITGEASHSSLNAFRFLRNKWSTTGAVLTVTKENNTDAAWTASVTTDSLSAPITSMTGN